MTENHKGNITIKEGYVPALIGRIVEMHARYYSELVGFGAAFESKVSGGLAEFVPRLGRPGNKIWHLDLHGRIIGSLAIDGEDLGSGKAHLRWFIIDNEARHAPNAKGNFWPQGFHRRLLVRVAHHLKADWRVPE